MLADTPQSLACARAAAAFAPPAEHAGAPAYGGADALGVAGDGAPAAPPEAECYALAADACTDEAPLDAFEPQWHEREELPLPGVRLVREAAASGAEARAARRSRLNEGADVEMESSSEDTEDGVYERHFAALRRQGFFQRPVEDPYQARALTVQSEAGPR